MMRLKTVLTAAAFAVACPLFAQAQGSTANLIRLNAAALNDAGEPVTDLKISDFQISDQGKSQKIAFFRPIPAAVPASPGEASNRTAPPPHSTVILFDLLNITQSDRLDIWHRIGRSLQQLDGGDSVYFYLLTLEGNLEPIHAFGGKAGDDHTWTQHVEQTLDKAMTAASHARPTQMNDEELVVKKTYVALETLANQLTALTGRRDIIWITSGMPQAWNKRIQCNGDWVDCALYVNHMAVTLAFDNVSVNPVTYTSNPNPDVTRDLEQMGLLTGGTTYVADDIRSVLKQVDRDAANSYSIIYALPPEAFDSKFHKIRVTVNRKGVKLHVWQRYFAFPDKTPETTKQHALLAGAFQSTVDDPAIGLRASIAAGAAGKPARLQIRVDPADLMLHENGGHFEDTLSILVSDVGAGGPIGEPALTSSNVNLSREERESAAKNGIPISMEHPLGDLVQKVRVIVLDQASAVVGSVTVPVTK